MESTMPTFYGPGSQSEKSAKAVERLKDPNFISEADEERKRKKRLWQLAQKDAGKKEAKPPEGVASESKTFYDRKRQETQLSGQ